MVGRPPGSVMIRYAEDIEIPRDLAGLAEFRRWAQSDSFPEKGRIDWIEGDLEIDMSPEELNFHGIPKAVIVAKLFELVDRGDRGVVVTDASRICSPDADVSAEPDVVVILFETIANGRARLVPREGGRPGCVEIEGAPDLVVECVSDSSVRKDTVRLRKAYFAAGIPEYWLVDARKDPPQFDLLVRRPGAEDYEAAPADGEGFARSPVLDRDVKLVRLPEKLGVVRYRLEMRDA